jgi:hypothetical protein
MPLWLGMWCGIFGDSMCNGLCPLLHESWLVWRWLLRATTFRG